jgi:hypothetical protein
MARYAMAEAMVPTDEFCNSLQNPFLGCRKKRALTRFFRRRRA